MTTYLVFRSIFIALLFSSCSGERRSSAANVDTNISLNGDDPVEATQVTTPRPAAASAPVRPFARSDISGAWPCDTGAAPGIVQTLPPVESRIASGVQYFAPTPSQLEYVLARGGPTGLFAYAHLHAISDGTGSTSNYAALIVITDQHNYYYAALPALHITLDGFSPYQVTHFHCGGQFVFGKELSRTIERAVINGRTISFEFYGGKNYASVLEILPARIRGEVTSNPENTAALVAAFNDASQGPLMPSPPR